MAWVKFDDRFWMHPKVMRAGNAAAWLWVASIGYCNANLTDGRIPTGALPLLTEATGKRRSDLVATLVDVGLWEPCEGGWMVHDYLEFQPSSAEVMASRAAASARVAKHRSGKKTERIESGNAVTKALPDRINGVGNAVTNGDVTPPPVPYPVPTPLPCQGDHGAGAPSEGDQLALLGDSGDKPTRKPRKSSAKPDAPPMPFLIGDALNALAGAAAGRFAAWEGRDITGAYAVQITAHIRKYPTLAEWETVGAWLADGADAHRGTLGVAWVASAAFRDAMGRARDWSAKGRPAASGRGSAVPPEPPEPVYEDWTGRGRAQPQTVPAVASGGAARAILAPAETEMAPDAKAARIALLRAQVEGLKAGGA